MQPSMYRMDFFGRLEQINYLMRDFVGIGDETYLTDVRHAAKAAGRAIGLYTRHFEKDAAEEEIRTMSEIAKRVQKRLLDMRRVCKSAAETGVDGASSRREISDEFYSARGLGFEESANELFYIGGNVQQRLTQAA